MRDAHAFRLDPERVSPRSSATDARLERLPIEEAYMRQRGKTERSKHAMQLKQLTIFPRGGPRVGAGRKPRGERAQVSHAKRESLGRYAPTHVTMRLVPGQRSLRDRGLLEHLLKVFANSNGRFDCHIVHYSIQSSHVHLIVEAADERALSRGMKGLAVRMAMTLNRMWHRSGPLFVDRFHAEALVTPRQARNALLYVLNNARKHGEFTVGGCDPFSSGDRFDGWVDVPNRSSRRSNSGDPEPCSRPRSWLLRTGWMRHGLIDLHAVPGPRGASVFRGAAPPRIE